MTSGPLSGVRIVEFDAIGPVPYAVMLLADMGAEVLRIARPDAPWPEIPVISRGRAVLELDLKNTEDAQRAREAISLSDVLVEGFRPGVMEGLGLGPDAICPGCPRLVYARMTGWGQSGPLARHAGHDLNYLAVSGLLSLLGRDGGIPQAPLNLLGDYAGGSMFLVMGILAALLEREKSGQGQVIDAAIVDGAASLLSPILGMARAGLLSDDPANGMLSGGTPCYDVYRCADGRDLSIAPLEPKFRAALCEALGLDLGTLEGDAADARAALTALFATKPSHEWSSLFANTEACAAPVLSVEEAMAAPHLTARVTYADAVPMPAPRFSRTPAAVSKSAEGAARLEQWRRA
jgi:alpha-methylacyl-CoA racemase